MIYKLQNKEAPWGDYGHILLAGIASHRSRQDGLLQLERTAPYIPPLIISGIGNVIITDATKEKLNTSGLSGFNFRQVIKKHIVQLNWTAWDLTAEKPFSYPDSGEPEDYILAEKHSESEAQQLGPLWELFLRDSGTFDTNENYLQDNKDFDIFKANNKGYILVTEKAKEWIEKNAGDWIVFDKI
jgi:hypothetical protein